MDRADRQGLGVALVGHAAVVAALVLGLFAPKPVPIPVADTMTVQLVPEAMMRSAAPRASREPPAPPKAEAEGKPEEAAPPKPSPAPEKPTPVPPRPAPPKPSPPKPAPPRPEPTPEPAPKPKPSPPKPKPLPPKPQLPKPAPKPAPAKAAPAKPAPAKTASTKAPPAKAEQPAPAKAAKPAKPSKAAKDDKDFSLPSDLRGRRRPDEDERAAGSGTKGKATKKTGSLLGSEFSKDIAAMAKESKGSGSPAAQVSARAMSGLIGIISAQVKPCYNPPAGGAGAGQIVTLLSIHMNRDGSVAAVTAGAQTGVTEANGAYAKQMADAARRAVLRCSPLKLPADLYEGGWDDFDFRFRPEQMQ